MSSPNSLSLRATHSRRGGCGGCHGGGLGSSVGTYHSPCLGQCSAAVLHVASGATTRQKRGGGVVSSMPYSTPACSLTFSNFVALFQGHLVSSLTQSQSTLKAKRKGNSRPQKGNAAKNRRDQPDTNDGTKYKTAEKRRGKIDTKDDIEYNDDKDVLPLTDAPCG
jgi:hypothetical protein